MLETVLAVAAPAVFLVRLLPQPLRLPRPGVDDGVSPMAAFNQLLSEGAWLTYGLIQSSVSIGWSPRSCCSPVAGRRCSCSAESRTVDLVGAAVFGVAIRRRVVAGLARGDAGRGSVLVTTGPQVVEALRRDDLTGIAAATWWISRSSMPPLWGALGWVTDDAALVGYWRC